ncbi:hypothetical protein EFD56_16525 [Rhizobium phaseoli]|uniref:competence protein CoiA family protein n=1 Tax=Rhizobium phaseoli TaxID=396 RepID=UPI000F865745|nr:competence protein CoiA family protein [Rhizobium phaseoli]RUM17791.1 hypothetical protein EFD56_16525 [Rhizobium phaseoli]
MKHRYARKENGEKVDILNMTRGGSHSREHFICFGCGRDLIAVLGTRREKHFRHVQDKEVVCSRETYLHALAKRQIAEGFLAAVQTRQPYTLSLPAERHCTRWKDELGYICQQSTGWRDFDLTGYFDGVREEAAVGGFVADVLLTSTKNDETLLVEVAVTHRCDGTKISSGLRIVEISISDEDQLALLAAGIDARANNVATYNMKRQLPLNVACLRNCGAELTAFFVYKSGKSRILTDAPHRIVAARRGSAVVYSRVVHEVAHGIVLPFLATDGYRKEVQRALGEGISVKCCFLCRYAGLDTLDKPVFCKIRRTEVGVNEAVDCSAYRPEIESR